MTQGNCRRLAAGTGPTRLTRGAPAPRPALRLLPGAPPLPRPPSAPPRTRLLSGRRASLRKTASPRTRRRGGRRRRGSSAGRPGRGRRTRVRRTGRGAPWPRPSPPPWRRGTAARLRRELCSFPSNYLSEQRPEGARRKGRPPGGSSPPHPRDALGDRGVVPVSSLPSLFCCVYSRIRTNLCCPPSHLGVCGVDTQRTQ